MPINHMQKKSFYRTPQFVSFFRAIESTLPKKERLFKDDYAKLFIDPFLKFVVFLAKIPILNKYVLKYIQFKSIGALSMGICRTKYIDDLVENDIKLGAKQLIILGAGFNTTALRLDVLQNIPVYEFDHPITSNAKKVILNENGVYVPKNIHYLQIEFNKETIIDFAATYQISFSTPSIIIWEATAGYLRKMREEALFEFLKQFSSGTTIIITYLHKDIILKLNSKENNKYKKYKKLFTEEENRWSFGFYPDELAELVKKYNLKVVSDLGTDDIRKKYIPQRKDFLGGFKFLRVVHLKKL